MRTKLLQRFCRTLLSAASIFIPLSLFAAPPADVFDSSNASVHAVMAVQNEVTADWMRQSEVLGTAVGLDANGTPALTVFIDRDATNASAVIRSLPRAIRGVGVQIELTDKFRAMGRPGGGGGGGGSGVSHTASQTPPIQLGTSGGWSKDIANGYCCGGTLGSLVSINGTQFILSCYHVFEEDIVPGGNGYIANNGDPIIQPGLIDVNCSASNAQNVGTLVKRSSLPNSNVDCSTAQVISGMVRMDGSILEIGTISKTTMAAFINQAVKKSGRTTGLSHSSVSGLNATISVTYENECAGGNAFNKTFPGQIVIANRASKFLNSGDSGSLMVEDVTTNPRPVGLLFAGSSTTAIANPIDDVLTFLGATMVGQ